VQTERTGLSCDREGLFLGRTPLLRKSESGFVPRHQADLERLLKRGFGIEVMLGRVMPGLAVTKLKRRLLLMRLRRDYPRIFRSLTNGRTVSQQASNPSI
jgi:hypothetical protein